MSLSSSKTHIERDAYTSLNEICRSKFRYEWELELLREIKVLLTKNWDVINLSRAITH